MTMNDEKTNDILYEGELQLGDKTIQCYVLEDGTRALSKSEMQRALGVIGNEPAQRSSKRLDEILSSKQVSRFISEDLMSSKLSTIDAAWKGTSIKLYDALALPELCEVMLKVRDYAAQNNIELGARQKAVIAEADILIRSLAKVGIIALIDEATGYQHEREQDELQKILKAYIAEELLPWQKRFPDVFYQELFRLNGWNYTVRGIKRRPGIIGKWTNKLIYEQLPPGVLAELKRVTPKSARLHQSLTADIGQPELAAQITQVVTIFRLSDNMGQMWSNFNKLQSRQAGQLELPFEFDENGHTLPSSDDGEDAQN